MQRELLTKLNTVVKEHQANLDSLLKKANLTQGDITKKVMLGEELPYAIAREVFYLDATARIVNFINYRSKDKNDWALKDYLEELAEEVLDWAEAQPHLVSGIKTSGQLDNYDEVPDNNLFPAIVFSSIKRHEEPKSNTAPDPEAA